MKITAFALAACVFQATPASAHLRGKPKKDQSRWQRNTLSLTRDNLCPTGRDTLSGYTVKKDSDFTEVSFIAYSQQRYKGHPVMWMGRDQENDEINAVDLETGEKIRTYKLDIKKDGDWESMSLGPCSSRGDKECIYIGNTGNNDAHKCTDRKCKTGNDDLLVYKLQEPDVNEEEEKLTQVTTLVLDYSHSGFPTKRADSETMFVDFTGDTAGGLPGDIYIVTKWPRSNKTHLERLGKVSATQHENLDFGKHNLELEAVGKPRGQKVWTGGDMRRDGKLIAMRDYDRVYFFPRMPEETVAEAMEYRPCEFRSDTKERKDQKQFEAVSMMGNDVAEASECRSGSKCDVDVTVYKLHYSNMSFEEVTTDATEPPLLVTNPATTLPPIIDTAGTTESPLPSGSTFAAVETTEAAAETEALSGSTLATSVWTTEATTNTTSAASGNVDVQSESIHPTTVNAANNSITDDGLISQEAEQEVDIQPKHGGFT